MPQHGDCALPGGGVARAGASVAIWSRRDGRNAEAVAELEGLGATAIGVRCDVSDEDNVADAMRATLDRFGAFLAGPSLVFRTGDSMVVDGGYTIF